MFLGASNHIAKFLCNAVKPLIFLLMKSNFTLVKLAHTSHWCWLICSCPGLHRSDLFFTLKLCTPTLLSCVAEVPLTRGLYICFSETLLRERVCLCVCIYIYLYLYVCVLWHLGVVLAVASKQNTWGMLDLVLQVEGYDSGLEAGHWQQGPNTFWQRWPEYFLASARLHQKLVTTRSSKRCWC